MRAETWIRCSELLGRLWGGFFGGLGVRGLIVPGLVVVQDLTCLLNPVHAHLLALSSSLFISLHLSPSLSISLHLPPSLSIFLHLSPSLSILSISLSKYSNIFGRYGHTYMEFEQATSSYAGKRGKGRFNISGSIFYDEILSFVSSL